jgi:hypothetical protein
MFTTSRFLPRFSLLLRPLLTPYKTPILPLVRVRALRTPTAPFFVTPFRAFRTSHLSCSPSQPPSHSSSEPQPSLSQRLKHLIKAYGWYALGVYLVIGALDFGVAFASINLFGAEHVSRFVTAAKDAVLNVIRHPHAEPGKEETEALHQPQGGSEGLYAIIVLAYTVHKTVLMPVRIGLTAALTPRLVGWLTRKGWAGRAGTKRAAEQVKERLRSRGQD